MYFISLIIISYREDTARLRLKRQLFFSKRNKPRKSHGNNYEFTLRMRNDFKEKKKGEKMRPMENSTFIGTFDRNHNSSTLIESNV